MTQKTVLVVLCTFFFCLPVLADQKKKHASWREDLLALHNQHREQAGAEPLKLNEQLNIAAVKHSRHMATTGEFAHEGIGDGSIKTRIEATGYQWGRIGENILWGAKDINKAMQMWYDSPPHRENVLRPQYQEVGFGYVKAKDGKQYWTACFGAPLKRE